jgi:hypothetical protein
MLKVIFKLSYSGGWHCTAELSAQRFLLKQLQAFPSTSLPHLSTENV